MKQLLKTTLILLIALAVITVSSCVTITPKDTVADNDISSDYGTKANGNVSLSHDDPKEDTNLPKDDTSLPEENEPVEPEKDVRLSGILLFDYTFILDGDIITLPLTLEEFQSYGWRTSSLSETFPSKTYKDVKFINKNDKEVEVGLVNLTDEALPINECYVYSISCSVENDYDAVIELTRGVILGVSNKDDVIKAFGEPASSHDSENDRFFMRYDEYNNSILRFDRFDGQKTIYNEIEIYTDNANGDIITKIRISNIY